MAQTRNRQGDRTAHDGGESVLERGARLRGRIEGDGDLRVLGEVEGDVAISGALEVEDGGRVQGDVEAASLSLGGVLEGDVSSRGPVAVRAGASLSGTVSSPEVSIEEGASFTGRIEIEFDMPAELTRPAR